MKPQFFKSTIESKFIKYLLSYTPLPLFPTISADDLIIEGCTYIYKDKLLKCTKTGRFVGIHSNNYIEDHLYVNDETYTLDEDYEMAHYNSATHEYDIYLPDEGKKGGPFFGSNIPGIGGLTVTDDVVKRYRRPVAEFEIIDDFVFGNYTPNITRRFISNVSYYDPETHRFLGEYLRCLRDIYDVDLMGLYNCFDYDMADNIFLNKNEVQEQSSQKVKVFLIPIKFNKTYTICLDSDFPVLMKSLFYDEVLLKDSEGNSLTDIIPQKTIKFTNTQFLNPITFKVTNDTPLNFIADGMTEEEQVAEYERLLKQKIITDQTLQNHEKYLYLAIQVSATNNSSIVVIEGDYSSVANNYVSDAEKIKDLSSRQLSQIFRSNLSLMQANDGNQYPYAEKLIAYLLKYTVDEREEIDENVQTIETAINYKPPIKDFYSGIWDNSLRYTLYNKYMNINNIDYIEKYDITGFVDRDIEIATQKGLINYGV